MTRLKYLLPVLISLPGFLYGCAEKSENDIPGIEMIDIDFNNKIENKGMAEIVIEGGRQDEYAKGLRDTCLNLSGNAIVREPVIISCADDTKLEDYNKFTVEVWAKKVAGDNQHYVIAGSKKEMENSYAGWEIAAETNGSWSWTLSDGTTHWKYRPTDLIQNLNDDQWHQFVFSLDRDNREARLYFDGKNRAVYSLTELRSPCFRQKYFIGADPLALNRQMEAFNGFIDGFKLWVRVLKDDEVAKLYTLHGGRRVAKNKTPGDKLTVMTWNIWKGGKFFGKTVGVDRVVDIIRNSGADVVLLQETDGSGERMADALNFRYFHRSLNLSVLSRFPLGNSYDIYKPLNFGCISIKLGDDGNMLFCPVWLDNLPNIEAYIKTGHANPDSIVERELQTRGHQIRFILGELSSFTRNSSNNLFVAGDFNSGSHLDWTERNKENYHGLVVEFPVSKSMEEQGFIDTYRFLHPDETEFPGQTWSPIFKETYQDRIDFIYFKGNRFQPVTSYVINSYSYGFPSSHAALVTVFHIVK